MTFHFQCDLSPALTNAGVSRFLITTIPSTLHLECANITLGFPVYWPSASKGSLCRLQFSTVGHFPQVRSMSIAKRQLEGGQIPYPNQLSCIAGKVHLRWAGDQLDTTGCSPVHHRFDEPAVYMWCAHQGSCWRGGAPTGEKKHVWAGYNPGSTYLVQGVLNDWPGLYTPWLCRQLQRGLEVSGAIVQHEKNGATGGGACCQKNRPASISARRHIPAARTIDRSVKLTSDW